MRNYILSFLFMLLVASCTNLDNPAVQNYWWKYGEGFHIGDALHFEQEGFNYLKDDTIFQNGKPVATIISCDKSIFRDSYVMKICSFSDPSTIGTYHQKGL